MAWVSTENAVGSEPWSGNKDVKKYSEITMEILK